MIIMDSFRFVALVHDLGKAFDRKNHQKAIVKVLIESGIKDWEIISCLKRFHQRGNGKDYLFLVKYAGQFSSELQRVYTVDYEIPQGSYCEYLKDEFMKQLKNHFRCSYLDANKLRGFISNNQILEEIPSDVRDVSRVSLREHSLLTDQVFCLLIEAIEMFPFSDRLDEWVRLDEVKDYLASTIERIPEIRGRRRAMLGAKKENNSNLPKNPKFNQAIVKLNSYGWEVGKIALHFGLLESEVRNILDS